jgi:hypothetical protein
MKIEPKWESVVDIIVCSHCQGKGISEKSEVTDYYRDNYTCWNEFCGQCDGEGRLLKTKYSFRIEFKTPDSIYDWPNDHKDHSHEVITKLDGRKTSDIYRIREW